MPVFCNLDCFDVDPNANIVRNWYRDADGDGAGNPSDVVSNCVPLNGRVSNNRDCNDNDSNDVSSWYIDSDGDGYGTGSPIKSCYQPAGYVNNSTDCDDNDALLNPSTSWYEDVDGDGLGAGTVKSTGCFAINSNDVKNNLDQCPTVIGEGTADGCPYVPTTLANGLSDDNYVYVQRLRKPVTNISQITSDDDVLENITYYDGVGRHRQSIAIRAGGNGQDIITGYYYDNYSRPTKEYLPYANASSQGGKLQVNPLTSTHSFYNTIKYENTLNPYSEKHLEASPLNRVLEQGAPGADWAVNKTADTDHTIKFGYGANTSFDYVRKFGVSFPTGNTEAPQLVEDGFYPAGQLYKTITKDENWQPFQQFPQERTTEEYKDKQGRVVLKRSFDKEKWLSTYYVYDDYGNLTYVLPPKAMTINTSENLYSSLDEFDYMPNALQSGGGWVEYSLWGLTTGFNFNIAAFDFTSGVKLNSGKMADLNFSPQIPDMVLGSIMGKDSNGNPAVAALVYIQDNAIYFNATNIGLYPSIDNYQEYSFYVNVDISNYIANTIDATTLNGLCYQYRYDKRNRLVEKKIPGKGWEYIVYNKLDQPVKTQDENIRYVNSSEGMWLNTVYDAFGRVAVTGYELVYESSRANEQNYINNYSTVQYVTKGTAPFYLGANSTPVYYDVEEVSSVWFNDFYTINYYDDYNFDRLNGTPEPSYGVTPITNAKGLATGTKVRVLDTNDWITTVNYYDEKSRLIYVYSFNDYLDTTDKVKYKLDFTGKVIETTTEHSKVGHSTITTVDKFYYDHAGRPIKQTQTLGSNTEVIAENHYDELGQLDSKGVGGKSTQGRLQTVDYTYNIRGWLKGINNTAALGNDLFGFRINYNATEHGATGLYNGNIGETEWRTAYDNVLRWYKYSYDALNRLTLGVDNTVTFGETLGYDKNGNINNLTRKGFNESNGTYGTIDQLAYTYATDSNQLLSVKDNASTSNSLKTYGFKDGTNSGNDYTYDANGNMVQDKNKGITSISYNHLNLPKGLNINDGGSNIGTISYIYDATGVKLEKKVSKSGTPNKYTYYAGNYVYEGSSLKFFNHPEGYVDAVNGYKYVYQYKDQLGNIRLSYTDMDSNGTIIIDEILEENSYLPFGLRHKGYNSNLVTNHKYQRYNGKEFEEALGLNMSEMTFRQYDPTIGRFNVVDRLSEFAYGITPYRFAFNNPIIFADPTGLFETRWEARKYKRAHNLRGGRISKQEDGSYAIEGKGGYHFQAGDDTGFSNDLFPNDGVVQSVLVTADKSDIADQKQRTADYIAKVNARSQEGSNFLWEIGGVEFVRTDSRLKAIASHLQFALPSAPIIRSSKIVTAVDVSEDVAVYLSKTTNGTVQYVGITNDLAIRQAQHLKGLGIEIEPLLQGLSRSDAKAVEQVLIEMYGLGGKAGQSGQLLNKINSIAKSNPIYAEALKRGRDLLQSIGYN